MVSVGYRSRIRYLTLLTAAVCKWVRVDAALVLLELERMFTSHTFT